MPLLDGKVALVTGSSRGIGAAIASAFAREGARVAVHGRDRSALAEVSAAIQQAGGIAQQVTGDVTNFADMERIRTEIEHELGPVDILVANAGGSPIKPGPLEEITEEGWRASIDANLTSTFLTIKSFLPGMKRRSSGNIITISSAAARRAHPQSPVAYAAAKAGIQMLTQHLAAQVGGSGIRVNCIAPETILTERATRLIPDEQKRSMAESHPIKRLGTPEDVARAAVFLASAQSEWITGLILDVSGGSVMST
jgi:3-oxoacyl-[acyl-carrier protein] reductase